MSVAHKFGLLVAALAFCAIAVAWGLRVSAETGDPRFIAPESYEMPFGASPYAPSNAQTTTGQFIPYTAFIPAKRCIQCHQSTHEEWSQSAHRNAFREPFYQANVNHLIRDRGIVATRHCESCHNPVALFSH